MSSTAVVYTDTLPTQLGAGTSLQDFTPRRSEPADDHGRMPARASLWMVYYQIFLVVVNTVVVIPTADEYARSLGAGEAFSGLSVALPPLFQGLAGVPLNYYMLRRGIPLKAVLILMTAGSVVGNVLYALAGLTRSKWSILGARAIIGLCGCELVGPLYIASTVGLRRRTRCMHTFGSCISIAFAVGPLLAGLLETFVKQLRIENLVLDSDTLPGWFMALLWFSFMVKLFFFFENPAPEQVSLEQQGEPVEEERLANCSLLVCLFAIFAAPLANTMCEVFTVKLAQIWWGWSVSVSAYYMAAVMAVVAGISFSFGRFTPLMEDRKGLLIWSMLGVLFSLLLFDYGYSRRWIAVAAFTVGLLFYQCAVCIIKSYAKAMVSKVVPAGRKEVASTISLLLLLLGRGGGTMLGALFIPNTFAGAQVALLFATSVVIGGTYSKLLNHAKAS